jgi:GT2 family glycosyltransferase
LLLLRPDVIPRSPGWLGELLASGATSEVAAVAPKLLSFDDTIHGAGIDVRHAQRETWQLTDRLRGHHREFAESNQAGLIPAASAACFLVRNEAYSRVGGISGTLLGCAYAGADLSLRLRAAGFQLGYAPGAELYLLNRPGCEGEDGGASAHYDDWVARASWASLLVR